MANNDPTFMGMPVEIRELIYEYTFTSGSTEPEPKAIDVLCHRQEVPNSSKLRTVSKFVYYESRRTYLNARKTINDRRKEVITDLIQQYDGKLAAAPPTSQTTTLTEVLTSLKSNTPCKNHTCNSADCHMCSNPLHQTCFDCGRNLAVALYCKLHPVETPQLIEPSSNGKPLPKSMGTILCSLPRHHTARLIPDRQPASPSPAYTFSWAWCWWQNTLQTQRAIDVRCCIRRDACRRFWRMFGEKIPFTEAMVERLERPDPRMADFNRVRKTIGHGVIAWEGEWAERVKKWVEKGEAEAWEFEPMGHGA